MQETTRSLVRSQRQTTVVMLLHYSTITIVDTTAPTFLIVPSDYTECSDEHPMDMAAAIDNRGEVNIQLMK